MVYLQRWHGWCHMKSLLSWRVLCTPYNHAPCLFMQSHVRHVHACLAVTCHLHFWQNGRGLLRANAVTWGWNGYRNKSQHRKWRRKFSRRSCRDSKPRLSNNESGALTTELSTPPSFQTNKGKRQKSGYKTYKRRSHLARNDSTHSNKHLYNNNNKIKNEDHEFIKKSTTVHENTNIKS